MEIKITSYEQFDKLMKDRTIEYCPECREHTHHILAGQDYKERYQCLKCLFKKWMEDSFNA